MAEEERWENEGGAVVAEVPIGENALQSVDAAAVPAVQASKKIVRPAVKKPVAPAKKASPVKKAAAAVKKAAPAAAPVEELVEFTGPREFKSEVAALAILAAKRLAHRFGDEHDNEADRHSPGIVRLSIKQPMPEGGHERIWVRVPDTLVLEVVANPEKISPE